MEIYRSGVTLNVTADLWVSANGADGEQARGRLANSGGDQVRIYPRIEFTLHGQRWVTRVCDHRYWNVDDYETDAETAARPCDSGVIDLTPDERATLQAWCDARRQPPMPTVVPAPSLSTAIRPIFAIGGLNRGDGAETLAPWPRYGRTCRVCGEAESIGAMFTTLGSDICDDCA